VDEVMVTQRRGKEKDNIESQEFSTGACFIEYAQAEHKISVGANAPGSPRTCDSPQVVTKAAQAGE
jgi:hypothetical protein